MTRSLFYPLLIAGLFLAGAAHAASEPAWVDSKEYKVLLDPSRFAGNPQSAAGALLQSLATRLEQLAFDKPLDGSFVADGDDMVIYYDTPGRCLLQNNGYSLRLREGGNSGAQFKYRHPDAELAADIDVSSAGASAKTKLETDISPGSVVYSHSTSQELASTAPATIRDVIAQFPSAAVFSAEAALTVVPVNGLHIHQQEYAGPSADLGKSKARLTLSLWYLGTHPAPSLVELSFKIKADSEFYFTSSVLRRSQTLMQAMTTLQPWTLSPSTTKTAWLYSYRSSSYPGGFCLPEARPIR